LGKENKRSDPPWRIYSGVEPSDLSSNSVAFDIPKIKLAQRSLHSQA
jgi:hypothetical protein